VYAAHPQTLYFAGSGITVTLGGGDSFVWSGSCAGLWRLINAYLAGAE